MDHHPVLVPRTSILPVSDRPVWLITIPFESFEPSINVYRLNPFIFSDSNKNIILEHIGNPNYPKVQPQIIPQRSDPERFGSKLRDQFKSPRDFPSLLPRKGPFQAHRQPPSISYPIHLDSFSNSSIDISAARSADQRKAGSWPRNPSFGLHLDGKFKPNPTCPYTYFRFGYSRKWV